MEEFLKKLPRGTSEGFHGGIGMAKTSQKSLKEFMEKFSEKFLECFSGEISSGIPWTNFPKKFWRSCLGEFPRKCLEEFLEKISLEISEDICNSFCGVITEEFIKNIRYNL